MFLLKEELTVQVAHIDRVQVNLQESKGLQITTCSLTANAN